MAGDSSATLMKNRFYEELDTYRRAHPAHRDVSMSDRWYQQTIEDIIKAKACRNRSQHEVWLLKNYDILNVNGINKLIYPSKGRKIFYVSDGELFDAVHKVHQRIGHVDIIRMMKVVNAEYKNVTRNAVELYIQLCQGCQERPLRPILKQVSRGQTTLIDFHTNPDGKYKFLLVYQDYRSKFTILRSLATDQPSEVGYTLLDVFTTFGAPGVLRYYNDVEFIKNVITYFRNRWPELKIVYDDYKYIADRASMVDLIKNIKSKLMNWMQEHNMQQWSIAAPFVQLSLNKNYNISVAQTPRTALFGYNIKLGLEIENSDNIHSEEDLEKQLNLIIDRKRNTSSGYTPPKPNFKKAPTSESTTTSQSTSEIVLDKSAVSESIIDTNNIALNSVNNDIPTSESIPNCLPSLESFIGPTQLINTTFSTSESGMDLVPLTESNNISTSEPTVYSFPLYDSDTNGIPVPNLSMDADSFSNEITEVSPTPEPIVINVPSAESAEYNNYSFESNNNLADLEYLLDIPNSELLMANTSNAESTITSSTPVNNIITPETIFESITSSESIFDTLPPSESVDDTASIPDSMIDSFRFVFK